jgi:hypothetical protein
MKALEGFSCVTRPVFVEALQLVYEEVTEDFINALNLWLGSSYGRYTITSSKIIPEGTPVLHLPDGDIEYLAKGSYIVRDAEDDVRVYDECEFNENFERRVRKKSS